MSSTRITLAIRRAGAEQSLRQRGFTLAELAVSIGMFALVAVALQSAVMLSAKAIPDAKGAVASQLAGSRVADQISSELSGALEFTELEPRAVAFTVADRDGDTQPEVIRYSWDAKPNGELIREYNGAAPVSVLENVNEFALLYDRRTQLAAATYTESAESLLYSYTGALLPGAATITATGWCGQYFLPTLPNGISSWRITRISFQAREKSSDDGKTRVQVRTATGTGLPTNVVVDQAELRESNLDSNWSWQTVTLSSAGGLSPSSGACVVFRWAENDESCEIQYQTLTLALLNGAKYVGTTNGGTSFTANALRSLPLKVYGTTTTKDPDSYHHNLTNVRFTLRAGANAAARVIAAVQVIAEPEVAAP